ncbi:tetratricopeptide repeat protein [Jeotgalibacillus marinus]|uniref:Tetratricopeptide repeat protein n=1 Tax=Jeotgalibacillus marinus TaxID=86667 RepID=A0ABV3Q0V6_9BACL
MNHLTTITLLGKNNRKTQLTPIRMAVHSPCTIMEATSQTGELYHAYFFRQQFLAAKKVTRSRLGSYLELAMTKGIVFLCPHPVVTHLLQGKNQLKNKSLTDLHSSIKNRYSPLEVSQIFRCFDSLIQKDKLFKVMRECYYDYRRDGKWGKAYSVLVTLEEAFPTHEWIAHTKHDASFSSYHDKYDTLDSSLLTTDPTTMDWLLWKHRYEPQNLTTWIDSFSLKSAHSLAAFSLLYEQQLTSSTSTSIHQFLDTAKHLFTQKELKDILLQMTHSPNSVIHQEAFRQCIRLRAWEDALTTFIQHPFLLEDQDLHSLKEAIAHVKWNEHLPIDQLSRALIPILKEEKHHLDTILTACVPILSQTHDLNYLMEWLKPLDEAKCTLPIYQRVQKLALYAEDPNKQFLAGELYYQLGLKNEAIDSFIYEMEMNPNDPSPVKWLQTLYQETGQLDEAAAYQQLLKSLC